MMYPPCGPEEDSLAPYTEIEVDPLVENNIDNDFNDKEVYDGDFDDEFKNPKRLKKSCSPMEMSFLTGNQKGN